MNSFINNNFIKEYDSQHFLHPWEDCSNENSQYKIVKNSNGIYLFDENGKKYMAANFKKLLLKISKEDEKKQNKLLEIELANWMKNEEQIDDVCIMGVRV